MKRQHRHAEALRWVADGEDIECSYLGNGWRSVAGNEVLQRLLNDGENYPENKFRIKPKMIRCGNLDFPAPMRVAPELDTAYWLADPTAGELFYEFTWDGDFADRLHLKRGFCHTTKEAAEAHARALISLTEVKP